MRRLWKTTKKRNLIKKKWWKRLEMKQLRRYCLRVAITMRSKQQNHLSYSQFWLNFCFNFLPLYHFLSPSPFSLCCHDQTAVHCICSCVPQKNFDVLLLSVVSQPNHLARVLFDIIFVNFEFNIARRLCATCHALGSRKTKKEKKIVTKTEVTFKEWGGGKTTRNWNKRIATLANRKCWLKVYYVCGCVCASLDDFFCPLVC